MSNIRQIRQRIGTSQNIAKITKAMEMVSASKMKKAQEMAVTARPYSSYLRSCIRDITSQAIGFSHPLLSTHQTGRPVLLIVSTDRGLCGGLNQSVFKLAISWHKLHSDGLYVVVGKKAVALARFLALDTLAIFNSLPDAFTSADLQPISTLITDEFVRQRIQSVEVVFADFVNTLTQRPWQQPLLPLTHLAGDLDDGQTLTSVKIQSDYVFEPNAATILAELLPYYLENSLYQTFLEAKASEHSARMVAMKNASDNAQDLVQDLRLIYNKSRQESITNELLDITTSIISLQQ